MFYIVKKYDNKRSLKILCQLLNFLLLTTLWAILWIIFHTLNLGSFVIL